MHARMADPERTSSFAKNVEGLHHEESALDRARALKEQFAHAQEQNNQKQAERPRETEKIGSQMIREDRPAPRPTPPGPMRELDRRDAYAKVDRERDNADAKIEAARKAQEAFKARQHGLDHDRDRDR
jgi:hypothetical protein